MKKITCPYCGESDFECVGLVWTRIFVYYEDESDEKLTYCIDDPVKDAEKYEEYYCRNCGNDLDYRLFHPIEFKPEVVDIFANGEFT